MTLKLEAWGSKTQGRASIVAQLVWLGHGSDTQGPIALSHCHSEGSGRVCVVTQQRTASEQDRRGAKAQSPKSQPLWSEGK